MLMRDAISLLEKALIELDEHDRKYKHATEEGLKENIRKFLDDVKPVKKGS